MKKHLITYGTYDYDISKNSLAESAKNYFDYIHVFGPNDIDSEFYEKNRKILEQKRGAGYWIWKPYFLIRVLHLVDDGDIVFYCDSGNVFINDPSPLLDNLEQNKGIGLFDNRDGSANGEPAQNFISCKKDCFVLMGCDTSEYVNGLHVNASYQIYKKNKFVIDFVYEYLDWCEVEEVVTDTPNTHGDNYNGYYDHRHDQSVLSLLSIKHQINLMVDPSEWGNGCEKPYPQIFYHHRKKNYKR